MTSTSNSYMVTIEILLIALIGAIAFIPTTDRPEFLDKHPDAGSLLHGTAGIKIGGRKRISTKQLKLF